MATSDDVKKWEEKYGSATAGGMDVKDESGNVIGNAPYSEDNWKALSYGRKLYQQEDGSFGTKPYVGVSINQDTGKITITAPKEYSERESFKKIINDDYLKSLSKAYKSNKNYKVPDPFNDSSENDITIPDLVSKFDSAIKSYADSMAAEIETRDNIRTSNYNRNGIADRLTESDMILMGASPWQAQAKDTDLLSIPRSMASIFANVKGYDMANSMFSKKEFLDNYWNLDKTSDADIQRIHDIVNDYFRDSDYSDTEEYARMTALQAFISNKTPDTGIWNNARVSAWAGVTGAKYGGETALLAIADMSEAVINGLNYITNPSNWGKPIEEMETTTGQVQAEVAFGTGNIGAGAIAGLVKDITGTKIGQLKAAKETYEDVKRLEAERAEDFAKLSSSAQAVFSLADFGANLAVNIGVGSALGGFVSGEVGAIAANIKTGAVQGLTIGEQLAVGATGEISMLDVATAANMTKSAVKVLNTTNKVATTMADLAAQSIVDAAIQDPVLFRQILEGKVTDENGKYLLSQAAWNVGGWGAAVGVKEIAQNFAKTSAGKAMNAATAKGIAKMSVGVADLNNKAHSLFLGNDWVSNIKNANKKAAKEANIVLTEAQRGVANAQGTEAITEAVSRLKAVQNATDALQRAGTGAVREYTDKLLHAVLAGNEDEIGEIATKIINAEKAAGIAPKARMFAKTSDTIRVFSKETANYIAARKEIQVLESIKNVTGTLTKQQSDGLVALRKMVSDSSQVMGKDLVALADEYILSEQKWWTEFNRIRVDQGLLNAAEIDELKSSGLWGENGELYARTQRVQGDPTYLHVRADNTTARKNVTLVDKYDWGSEKDFADPMVTRYEAMVQAGVERNSKQYFDAVRQIPGIKSDIVIGAAETERVRQVKKFRTTFEKHMTQSMKEPIANAFSSNGIMRDAIDLKAWNLEVLNAKKSMNAAEASVKRAETIKIDVRRVDREYAISSMTDEFVDDLVAKADVNGTKINSSVGQEFQDSFKELPEKTKAMVNERAKEIGLDGITDKRSWNRVVTYSRNNYGEDFVSTVNRSVLQNTKALRDSEEITKYVTEMKRAKIIADRESLYRNARNYFQTISGDSAQRVADDLTDRVLGSIDKGLDSFVDTTVSDAASKKVLDAVIEQSGTTNPEAAKEYLLLNQLRLQKEEAKKAFSKELKTQLTSMSKGQPWLDGHKKKMVGEVEEMFDNRLEQRMGAARQVLLDEGGNAADLVDKKYMYSQISALDRKITGKKSAPNIVAYQNAQGAIEYIETSPLVADLYNFKPTQTDMNAVEKVLNTSARLFRLGTTGVNITSMVNQQIRDFGNAWLAGGMWRSFKGASNRLESEWGQSVADAIQRSDPEAYQSLLKVAEETGEDVGTVAVKQVQARAEVLAPGATETAAYRRVIDGNRQRFSVKNKGALAVVDNAIDAGTEKLGKVNEMREQYLRRSVYMNGFYEALQRGETYEQALTSAQFVMNNATTNFSRLMVHGQRLQKTVPYLGAAINGTKSFWRIFAVDPVGVGSRLFGGAVFPMMAITANNMGDPANREKYMQFAEYEKDESIIIGVNGQFVKVPIPQEIAPILAPFRQMVEGMYGSDKHSFWELAVNDALGFSPVDLSGFYDLDFNDLAGDATFWDRTVDGTSKLVAQLLPPPFKSIVMRVTGKDPYTGKKIDTRYSYYDEDSGSVQIMDSSQSAFAKVIAGAFGGSAQLAEKITANIFGQTGLDILDIVTSAAQAIVPGGEDGSLTALPERVLTEATKPLTVQDYDRTQSAWNQEIRMLYDEKNEIINDEQGQYQKISQQINMAKSDEERTKLINQRKSLLEPWQKKVGTLVQRFQERYGESAFDRFRLASVISLLNPYENQAGLNAADRASEQEQYYSGRNEAIQTLIDMGCNGAGDTSMLGYITRDSEGNIGIKYNTPLEILAAQNAWYKARDINLSKIQLALETGANSIKNQRSAMWAELKAADSYDKKDDIRDAWNQKVIAAIYPYVQEMSADAIIGNDEIVKYLENYIEVPSYWEKVKNRYVSSGYDSKTGTYKLNKNMGFIESYLRKVFE